MLLCPNTITENPCEVSQQAHDAGQPRACHAPSITAVSINPGCAAGCILSHTRSAVPQGQPVAAQPPLARTPAHVHWQLSTTLSVSRAILQILRLGCCAPVFFGRTGVHTARAVPRQQRAHAEPAQIFSTHAVLKICAIIGCVPALPPCNPGNPHCFLFAKCGRLGAPLSTAQL